MVKPVKVTSTDLVFAADAVCVLYANIIYADKEGVVTECPTPISGIFQACTLEVPPRKDENGYLSVYVWCYINNVQPSDFEDGYWVILKVPPHGLIELPDYCGEIIDRISVN